MIFTVVTAIKNGFPDFRKTYPTVLAQSHPDFEWIIVDDGSSTPLSQEFPDLLKDPRVKVFRHEAGQGQTKSLNEGIRAARGTWIVRMDGDDLCAPDRLEKIEATIASHSRAELIFSDYLVIDGEDREWASVKMAHPLPPDFFRYLEEKNNPLCHPTVAFRRLHDGKPRQYREDLVNAQDYALWKEILSQSGPESFAHIPSPTVRYRIARDSLSGARAPEQKAELEAIRAGKPPTATFHAALRERQKEAMQSYRLLYYRFVGQPSRASFLDDLYLFGGTAGMPRLVPKAVFYLLARPFRHFVLPFLFGRIYE